MSNAPKPPLAVRLARLAHPGRPWCVPHPDFPHTATAVVERELSGVQMIGFNINSLNDIALAEQRVVEAGLPLTREYGTNLRRILRDAGLYPSDGGASYSRTCAVATATAAQRAAALEAVLDAHPELENQQ